MRPLKDQLLDRLLDVASSESVLRAVRRAGALHAGLERRVRQQATEGLRLMGVATQVELAEVEAELGRTLDAAGRLEAQLARLESPED